MLERREGDLNFQNNARLKHIPVCRFLPFFDTKFIDTNWPIIELLIVRKGSVQYGPCKALVNTNFEHMGVMEYPR